MGRKETTRTHGSAGSRDVTDGWMVAGELPYGRRPRTHEVASERRNSWVHGFRRIGRPGSDTKEACYVSVVDKDGG